MSTEINHDPSKKGMHWFCHWKCGKKKKSYHSPQACFTRHKTCLVQPQWADKITSRSILGLSAHWGILHQCFAGSKMNSKPSNLFCLWVFRFWRRSGDSNWQIYFQHLTYLTFKPQLTALWTTSYATAALSQSPRVTLCHLILYDVSLTNNRAGQMHPLTRTRTLVHFQRWQLDE